MYNFNPYDYSITVDNPINCFEICGSDFAQNLICIAITRKLTLGLLCFPEEGKCETFEWKHLRDIHHESRCHAICFAPTSTINALNKSVTFCSAGSDFILRIFRTNLKDSDTVQMLEGHKNYINDCSWDNNNNYLASVSDDQYCKIWSSETNYENIATFCLSSAGMSVKWHPEEPQKILVAEKKGIIHMYNVHSQQCISSIECPKLPLMSADWALSNCNYISALSGGEIVMWDLARRSYLPSNVKRVHEDGGRWVRFSPISENIVASIGRPKTTLKVFNTISILPLLESQLKLCAGLAWHHRLPYLAAACDNEIYFWKVYSK